MDKFRFERQSIPEVFKIVPRQFGDARGYFMETYAEDAYREAGIIARFIQDNQSLSVSAGVVRGLHFQAPPFAQAKLVRVLAGSLYDVAVDIRRGSPTYGHACGAVLTADGAEQFFIPHGFAHGFLTLEPDTIVTYKVDGYYNAKAEGAILWNSPALSIAWPFGDQAPVLSAKDAAATDFADFVSPFRIDSAS